MARFLVSGLLNVETSVKVKGFPIDYYPIDYPFFGVSSSVGGVAFNISRALKTLGDDVSLCSMKGGDLTGRMVTEEAAAAGIGTDGILLRLSGTPCSAVLYDGQGRRQIHCDLKDIQQTEYGFDAGMLSGVDAVIACNINFNRPLLRLARENGKLIATDVHVLSDPDDGFNREFMEHADVLFLSDEGINGDKRGFIRELVRRYPCGVIVLGMGAEGALLYQRANDSFVEQPAWKLGGVVNTVGAGDALFASFMHFFVKGVDAALALEKAQLFAAMKIRHSGASVGFPSEAEVLEYTK